MTLLAGTLREKLNFSRSVRVPNGSGGFVTTYTSFLNTFAAIVEERSNPQLIASQENTVNQVHFKIRYRPDFPVKNADRMTWRGFIFTVNNIKVDPLRTQIDIYCNSEMETSER
jgi:SPP1 family predicted phage head-tail adaptor